MWRIRDFVIDDYKESAGAMEEAVPPSLRTENAEKFNGCHVTPISEADCTIMTKA